MNTIHLWFWIAGAFPTLLTRSSLVNALTVIRSLSSKPNQADTSGWENNGFEKANTTQMSRNFGDIKHNVSFTSVILMASKSAKLETYLKNFDRDFLHIDFSSMIGKSVGILATTTTTKKPLTSSTTSTTPSERPVIMSSLNTSGASSFSPFIFTENKILNSTSVSHQSIIQITLDPSNPAVKTEIHKVMRKRRELDSKDLQQIHEMIASANVGKGENHSKTELAGPPQTIIGNEGEVPDKISVPVGVNETIQTSYTKWRTSTLSKNRRPPGLYLSIDDQVIYDNWGGVWNNFPNVMGKWNSDPQLLISNRTSILYTFDKVLPGRSVKVSFEWEPPDSTTFLFLDDISISTYEPQKTSKEIPTNTPISTSTSSKYPIEISDGPSNPGNRNITIFIIVKSESSITSPNIATTTRQTFSTITTSSTSTATPLNMSKVEIPENVTIIRNRSSHDRARQEMNYALIVLAVLGCSFFVILMFLLWIKMNDGKKCGRIHC